MKPRKLNLSEWSEHYRELVRDGLCEPDYGGPLDRHVARESDLRLRHLQFDNSAAALRLWNFLLTENERLHRAYARGERIVGTMKDLGTIPVMAYSLPGLRAFYPDGAWWTPCLMECSDRLFQQADALGVDASFCPVRALLGAFQTGEHFPRPDLLICSAGAVCDDFSAIAQRLETMGFPILWWEMPRRRRPEASEVSCLLPGGWVAPQVQVDCVREELRRILDALNGLADEGLERKSIDGRRHIQAGCHLPPHPQGEGTLETAYRPAGLARQVERQQTTLPLPKGEGRGEGKANDNLSCASDASEAALAAGIRQANKVRHLLQALRNAVYLAQGAPLPALEMLIAEMLAIHFCSDRDETIAVLTELLAEVQSRLGRSEFVIDEDAVRVFWVNPVADLRAMNLLEEWGGRICGSDYMFTHALELIPEDLPPLEALARTALADPMVGSTLERAARIASECKTSRAEAVVVSRIPGASHCAREGSIIRDFIQNELGLPTVEIEVPSLCDAMLPALSSRLQALVETARGSRSRVGRTGGAS